MISLAKKDRNKDNKVTGLEEVQNQFEAGTLQGKNRDTILTKTQENIGNLGKQEGLQKTRDELSSVGVEVAQQESITTQPISPNFENQQIKRKPRESSLQPSINSPFTEGQSIQQPAELSLKTTQPLDTPKFTSIDPKTGEGFDANGKSVGIVDETKTDTPTTTGIPQVDAEINKLRGEKEDTIVDTIDSYNLVRGEIESQKANYMNFDEVNGRFENVMEALRSFGDAEISEAQYQDIANRLGVSIDEVKNPTKVFEGLKLSEEGRRNAGATGVDRQLEDAEARFERTKEDLTNQLSRTKKSLTQQMEDTAVQVGRSIAYAEANGTWSGGLRSSGFQSGLDNMRSDSDKTIGKLETAIQQSGSQNETIVRRLTDDYETAVTRTKQDLDDSMRDVKTQNSLALSDAIEKYGMGSEELTKALNAIDEEFGTASLDIFNKYLTNMKGVQEITNTNLETYQKTQEIEDAKTNKRYNELLENNGVVLLNSSLNSLAQQVENGVITPTRYNDLKRIMQSSITSTLGDFGTLNQADLNTIDTLLNQGKTPTEVVAKMQENKKFAPKAEVRTVEDQIDLGDRKKIIYSDGTSEIIAKGATPTGRKVVKPGDVIQNSDGTFTIVPEPSDMTVGKLFSSSQVSGILKQVYGSKSPLGIDNVELANGQLGTPGVDIAGISGSAVKPFVEGTVVGVTTGQERGDAGYGNQVIIKDANGNIHMYNHLGDVNVSNGDIVTRNTDLGTMSNTGSTIGKTGTHLDYRVSGNGKTRLSEGLWIDPSQFMGEEVEITASDITKFNNSTFKPQDIDDPEVQKKYDAFLENQDKIFGDMNADFFDVIGASRGGGKGSVSEREQIGTYTQALGGLIQMSDNLGGQKTGPVVGRLKKLDPLNPDVAEFKAIVAGLVPTVARGVFNEVGVLTDTDIKNYLGTLPKLENTDKQNKLVTAALLKTLSFGMKAKLSAMARSDIDVSKFDGQIEAFDRRVADLEAEIGIPAGDTEESGEENQDEVFDSLFDT